MRVLKGINPNCSEAVVRLSKEDYLSHEDEIDKVLSTGSFSMSQGREWTKEEKQYHANYSTFLPSEGYVLFYFGQEDGLWFTHRLEDLKLYFDYEPWLTTFDDEAHKYEPLATTVEEVEWKEKWNSKEFTNWSDFPGDYWRKAPYDEDNEEKET